MPIKVSCTCGQSFAAKDELAGKTVKCPKCAQPLRIPSPAAPKAAMAGASAAPATGMNSLFDDAGMKAAPVGANLCPGCSQPLPANAVLCVKCGYNVKLGRKMTTVSSGKSGGGHGAHGGDAAETLLARAAESIEDAAEAERMKTGEGLPWWVYLVGMLATVGFMAMMMFLTAVTALTTAAFFLFGIGGLVCMYSGVRIIMVAFEESPVQGILYLLVPFYPLYYIATRWETCAGFFIMNCGGVGIGLAGWGFLWGAGIAANWKSDDEDAALHVPRPAIVRVEIGIPSPQAKIVAG
jgi:hypothetical protein